MPPVCGPGPGLRPPVRGTAPRFLYRDCPDPKTKAWFDATKAKKDAEKAKTALAADATPAPASALVSAGEGGGTRASTVTISGDHSADERALLAQLSGFLDSAAPSKVVHWSETVKTVHSAHVAKTKFIDGVAQLVDPSADELRSSCAMARLPSIPSLPQHSSPTRLTRQVWARSRTRTCPPQRASPSTTRPRPARKLHSLP